MSIADHRASDDDKVRSVCQMVPFWQPGSTATSSHRSSRRLGVKGASIASPTSVTVSSIAKSFLPPRRRLRLDPPNKLYFPYEPGKQVRSAIGLKNISKSHTAFKFQTTAPKSCYMRPPGGILAPGETLVATVFKFVEPPETNDKSFHQRSRVKFKIMSLKVNGDVDYIPELFEEQRDQVSVEQILRVVFLDTDHPSPALDRLKHQLAEAEAAVEERRKPQKDVGPQIGGEGLIIDEWKERRERYLARQHEEAIDLSL